VIKVGPLEVDAPPSGARAARPLGAAAEPLDARAEPRPTGVAAGTLDASVSGPQR
jgi:hypothetical protein